MKKRFVFPALLALLAVSLFFACQKEQDVPIESIKRVHFDSFEDFKSTMDKLDALHSKDELDAWSKQEGHGNLLFSEDDDLQNLPFAFLAILNPNSEFEYKDSIIWYNNGILYGFSKADEASIPEMKKTPEQCYVFGKAKVESQDQVGERLTQIGVSSANANNQFQFNQSSYAPCNGVPTALTGVRKYVHEVYSFYTSFGASFTYRLKLRLKLEYRTSTGKWKAAGEKRNMDVNVSGMVALTTGTQIPQFVPFAISDSKVCSNDVEFFIAVAETHGFTANTWHLDMDGTITHGIVGDSSDNIWENSGGLW